METITGVFPLRAAAELTRARLESNGFSEDNLILLAPGASPRELDSVPTEGAEQPGMGKAVGGVIGGAVGLAAGAALANIFLPGVGPVVALGLGVGGVGAATGASGGDALETMLTRGLPKDEIFFYEDALRQGRSIVVVLSKDENLTKLARDMMVSNGAESIDAAREQWWIGLRDAEALEYSEPRKIFEQVERQYRLGFEAAQQPGLRGKTLVDAQDILRQRFGEIVAEEPFRRGYIRGQVYASTIQTQTTNEARKSN